MKLRLICSDTVALASVFTWVAVSLSTIGSGAASTVVRANVPSTSDPAVSIETEHAASVRRAIEGQCFFALTIPMPKPRQW